MFFRDKVHGYFDLHSLNSRFKANYNGCDLHIWTLDKVKNYAISGGLDLKPQAKKRYLQHLSKIQSYDTFSN